MVYVRDTANNKYYKFLWSRLTEYMQEQLNNYALISCGLTVGEAGLTRRRFTQKILPIAVEVTEEKWRHSGCQSACILRGDEKCAW